VSARTKENLRTMSVILKIVNNYDLVSFFIDMPFGEGSKGWVEFRDT
jgi:hypothetical protein